MKATFVPLLQFPSIEIAIEQLTTRYKAAVDEYQDIVDRNARLNLTGSKPSQQALRDEERAFEELDCARHALLEAAARASPTLH